jgi:hypothetical protein
MLLLVVLVPVTQDLFEILVLPINYVSHVIQTVQLVLLEDLLTTQIVLHVMLVLIREAFQLQEAAMCTVLTTVHMLLQKVAILVLVHLAQFMKAISILWVILG